MNRCSFREWIPILPWPVWPLAGQCLLGQKTVVGSMRILLLAVRGNIARRSMSGPRFLYNFTTPRLGVELPVIHVPCNYTITVISRPSTVSSERFPPAIDLIANEKRHERLRKRGLRLLPPAGGGKRRWPHGS